MRYYLKKYYILGLLVLLFSISSVAQSDLSSPYSRFGLGDISTGSPNTILKGMGGISNAMSGKTLLNPNNPASYASLDTLSLVFDAGFYIKTANFSTNTLSEPGSNASFD